MDTLAPPRTRSTYDLLRGSSSLSAHKTSATTLTPLKLTSNVHPGTSPSSSTKKRKKKEDPLTLTETDTGLERSSKKVKLGSHEGGVGSSSVTKTKSEKKKKTRVEKDSVLEAVKAKGQSGDKAVGKDKKRKKKRTANTAASEDEGSDEAVEDTDKTPSSDSEEGGGEYTPPVHESLVRTPGPDSASSSKKNKKYVPPGETPDQRDSRTIFVGNVPSQVMVTKVSWRYTPLPGVNRL